MRVNVFNSYFFLHFLISTAFEGAALIRGRRLFQNLRFLVSEVLTSFTNLIDSWVDILEEGVLTRKFGEPISGVSNIRRRIEGSVVMSSSS